MVELWQLMLSVQIASNLQYDDITSIFLCVYEAKSLWTALSTHAAVHCWAVLKRHLNSPACNDILDVGKSAVYLFSERAVRYKAAPQRNILLWKEPVNPSCQNHTAHIDCNNWVMKHPPIPSCLVFITLNGCMALVICGTHQLARYNRTIHKLWDSVQQS